MALSKSYVHVYGQLEEFFKKIQDGQAPERFTQQYIKDLGYSSSNHRALIPLLKSLDFLTSDGSPTQRYHEYRNRAQARRVIGEALKEVYSELFTINENPSQSDRALIEGKFKSTHNVSDNVARLLGNTFFALMEIADLDHSSKPAASKLTPQIGEKEIAKQVPLTDKPKSPQSQQVKSTDSDAPSIETPSLHYNIQIHLPASKDVEVFNAIFKSLKEHLLE